MSTGNGNGQPGPTNMYELIYRIAREWGIFAAMCAFFIWRADVRERQMIERIESQETFMRERFIKTVDTSTAVIATCNTVLARFADEDDRNGTK